MSKHKTGLLGEHELLTPTGWTKTTNIYNLEFIAGWWPNRNIAFVKPTNINITTNDVMCAFRNHNRHISQCVNEDHNVFYYTKAGNLSINKAINSRPNPYSKHPLAGWLVNKGAPDLTNYERFLIALQADGTICDPKLRNGKINGCNITSFYFKKQRKIKRFTKLLELLEYRYTIYQVKELRGGVRFTVWVPLGLAFKTFEEWVDLSDKSFKWCDSFIHELKHWDGHIKPKNPGAITWSSTIKSNTDIVQAIAVLANMRTCYTHVIDDRKETYSDIHRLNILVNRNFITGNKIIKDVVKLDKPKTFYNFEVPSGFIITRHNGAVSIIGDSKTDTDI